MKIILITLTIMLTSTICYGQDSSNVFRAQRFKNDLNFQKPYRILKTTFKNLDEFQTVELISNMYFGSNEMKEFSKK